MCRLVDVWGTGTVVVLRVRVYLPVPGLSVHSACQSVCQSV